MCGVIIMESAAGILILIKKLITSSFCWIQTNKFQSCFMNISVFCFVFVLKAFCLSAIPANCSSKQKLTDHLCFQKSTFAGTSAHIDWTVKCVERKTWLYWLPLHTTIINCLYIPRPFAHVESGLKYVFDDTISLSQPIFLVIIHWSDKTRRDNQQNNQRVSVSLFALTSTAGLHYLQSNYFPLWWSIQVW